MSQIQRHVRTYLTTSASLGSHSLLALDNYIKLPIAEGVLKREKKHQNHSFLSMRFLDTNAWYLFGITCKKGKKKSKQGGKRRSKRVTWDGPEEEVSTLSYVTTWIFFNQLGVCYYLEIRSAITFNKNVIFYQASHLCCIMSEQGWGKPACTLVFWRQGFRHPARNECMGWFARIV